MNITDNPSSYKGAQQIYITLKIYKKTQHYNIPTLSQKVQSQQNDSSHHTLSASAHIHMHMFTHTHHTHRMTDTHTHT